MLFDDINYYTDIQRTALIVLVFRLIRLYVSESL